MQQVLGVQATRCGLHACSGGGELTWFCSTWDRCYDFLKYFRQKIQRKNWRFFTQNKAKVCKTLIITLVFEKDANFFAENCQKSQKIVIITSTPVPPVGH
jgi:hypothetical protein